MSESSPSCNIEACTQSKASESKPAAVRALAGLPTAQVHARGQHVACGACVCSVTLYNELGESPREPSCGQHCSLSLCRVSSPTYIYILNTRCQPHSANLTHMWLAAAGHTSLGTRAHGYVCCGMAALLPPCWTALISSCVALAVCACLLAHISTASCWGGQCLTWEFFSDRPAMLPTRAMHSVSLVYNDNVL